MPLHPSARALLELMGHAGLGISPDTTPAQARERMDAIAASGIVPKHPVHAVVDREIAGVPVRVYRPSGRRGLPVVVWFHGGGWVLCSLDTHDQLCRLLCDAVGAVVVSVGYRLAPEAKFPAAVDDCTAVYTWVRAHGGELDGDPSRVAIGGDSAGGNLAAAVALVVREHGLAPPAMQLLVYPVTDYEFDSPSMIDNATGYFLEREHMRWFFDHYARTPADFGDWRMSPLRVPDCSGLPTAVVITAELDPLRDQGEAYGRRLQESGVATEIIRGEGVFHGFFAMHAFLEPAKEPWDRAVAALRRALGTA